MLLLSSYIISVVGLFVFSPTSAQWTWVSHGKPPISTGLSLMMSGTTPKLFGVGRTYNSGQLHERSWSVSASQWTSYNHGSAPMLRNGEWLYSKPCVLADGKLFIVTNKLNVVERLWTSSGGWQWVYHGRPNNNVAIRAKRCTCTTTGNVARVFFVGYDNKVYERYWSSASNSWTWNTRGSPPGTLVSLEHRIVMMHPILNNRYSNCTILIQI